MTSQVSGDRLHLLQMSQEPLRRIVLPIIFVDREDFIDKRTRFSKSPHLEETVAYGGHA